MSPQFSKRTHRAREILYAVSRSYPNAWVQADQLRQMRGRELPDWADWCYLPIAGAYAIVSGGGDDRVPFERSHRTGIIAALATWRMTQGIYRIDSALHEALINTPIEGDIPESVLYRLPEWCVYIETPDLEWDGRPLYGVWAHLEEDANNKSHELRLVIDAATDTSDPLDPVSGCCPVPIILGPGGLVEGLKRVLVSGGVQARKAGFETTFEQVSPTPYARTLAPILSLILYLYLCTEAADITGRKGAPKNPEPVRTRRHGTRLFAADGPTTWDVGMRIGAALRAAYQREETERDPVESGRHVRPHVRRAHWHTFVSGPRSEPEKQRRQLRWLPPIAVAISDYDELPAVMRRVE